MSYYLGVDLGTTFTAAALARDGRAEPVSLGSRSVAVPSVVYISGDDLVVGQPAVRRATTEPSRVASEFKRRVGDPVPILLDRRPVAPEDLMARLFEWVLDQVVATEGAPPLGVAVTHPANWGEYKLDLLRRAVGRVGLPVDHFVAEPVAAANFYAAGRDLPEGTIIAVYDLGGGTFDAALLGSERTGFRILGAPDGIDRLGGIDFDQAVLRHVADVADIPLGAGDDEAHQAGLAQLRADCAEAKEALSADTDVAVPVMLPGLHTKVRLTRLEFEAMVEPALRETVEVLRRTIASAGVAVDDVSAVLLVGGSSRIPLVAQLVTDELGRPIAVDARPKDAISLGAAITAWRSAAESAAAPGVPAPPPPVPVLRPDAGPPPPVSPASPVAPLPPPSPSPAPPPPGEGRRRRSGRRPAVAAVAGVVLVAGAVFAATTGGLFGGDGDGDRDGEEQVPPEAVARFEDACRVSGISDDLCTCALEGARTELTPEQFMANDRLLSATGFEITAEVNEILLDCRQQIG